MNYRTASPPKTTVNRKRQTCLALHAPWYVGPNVVHRTAYTMGLDVVSSVRLLGCDRVTDTLNWQVI